MNFQENLRHYREQAKFTPTEMAKHLKVAYNTYVGYEVRGREPKYTALCKIADLLQVSTDDLLGREDNYGKDNIAKIRNKIMKEVLEQKKQWGDEYHLTPHQWLGLIQEEVEEIAQAINETYLPN